MKVVSWNIEHGIKVDQAITELTSITELADADIILLQEMSPESVAAIADGLGLDYRFGAVADSCETGRPFGNAVLSPWPMGETDTIPLPLTARKMPQPRCAVHTTVEVNEMTVNAISIHLETVLLSRRGRARQAVSAARAKNVNRPEPTVLGGDLNSASVAAIRAMDRSLANASLTRLTDGTTETFRRFGLPFTLDHVYGRGVQATASGVVAAATASDHQPIWVELDL